MRIRFRANEHRAENFDDDDDVASTRLFTRDVGSRHRQCVQKIREKLIRPLHRSRARADTTYDKVSTLGAVAHKLL